MNTATEFLTLVRVPERRPRTLLDVAADLAELAGEVVAFVEAEGQNLSTPLGEAADHLCASMFLLEAAGEEEHTRRLSALEASCVACGHDRGTHLVDAPHACDHEGEHACACSGFAGLEHAPEREIVRDTERPPAPAADA